MTDADAPRGTRERSGDGSDGRTNAAVHALQAADVRLAEARAERDQRRADLERLGALIARAEADARAILRSPSWRLGHLLVHRVGKRLLGRRNLSAPWAPERVAEVAEAFERWRGRADGGGARRSEEEGAPGPAAAADREELFERTVEAERELYRIGEELRRAGRDVALLRGWLRQLLEAGDQLLSSNRWRIGVWLCGRPAGWLRSLVGAARPAAEARVAATRDLAAAWEGERGVLYGRFSDRASPPALGPAAPRPRLRGGERRIDYPGDRDPARTVSIAILNRNGATQLHNLFVSFLEVNSYPWVEILVVDHASRDDSAEVVRRFQEHLPIEWIPYEENHSFAYSNNRAAERARGAFLLFLNNDIVFREDVLPRLVARLDDPTLGAVGPELRYPEYHEAFPGGTQHRGIRFRPDAAHGFYRPFNLSRGDGSTAGLARSTAVTAAALLCRRRQFLDLGGFDEDFVYGYEDVDLCLRYRRDRGLAVACDLDCRLVHDESLTQRSQSSDELRRRRLGNIAALTERFGYAVKRAYWRDLVAGGRRWASRPANVGFAVEEVGPAARAGDLFTAEGLGRALEECSGAAIRFLPRQGQAKDWYDVRGLDLLVVMLDAYDVRQIHGVSPGLLRIAWMRNWFDRWADRPWFGDYDLYLCSSEAAVRAIRERTGRPAHLLRIATDAERFCPGEATAELASDYCFTGSFWGVGREIEKCLRPGRLDARFALFGAGWQDHRGLRRYSRGFIPHSRLPEVYRSTRIVVDDANHATRRWGSVNSRVYDGLACGALVVTNGEVGADELFGGRLPTYSTAAELEALVRRYLADEEARRELAESLRLEVVRDHTYRRRAESLLAILDDFLARRFRIAIKVPAPDAAEARQWGDYHMALALQRRFESCGHRVRIDLLPDWETPAGVADDVVLVLRGLSRYRPRPLHLNLMWNISHPDKVSDEEYEEFDHVFVASASYALTLQARLAVPVSELLQCTDPALFHPESGNGTGRRVLFVGNSRRQRRPIVLDAIAAGLPLSVFGAMWEGLIPERFVEGDHIPNDELHRYYSDAGVLLNDHWPSMKAHGFVSNRLFDAGACGACVVSDEAVGLGELFGDAVATYDGSAEDLRRTVEDLLADPERRGRMGARLRETVTRGHTFDERAREILRVAAELHGARCRGLLEGESLTAAPAGADAAETVVLAGSEDGGA